MISVVYINILLGILTIFLAISTIITLMFSYSPLQVTILKFIFPVINFVSRMLLVIIYMWIILYSLWPFVVYTPHKIAIAICTIVIKIERLWLNIISHKTRWLVYCIYLLIFYYICTICIDMIALDTDWWYSIMNAVLNSYMMQHDVFEHNMVYINYDPNGPDLWSKLVTDPFFGGLGGPGGIPPKDSIEGLLSGYQAATREDFKEDPWISTYRPDISKVSNVYVKLLTQKSLLTDNVSQHLYHPLYEQYGVSMSEQDIKLLHKVMSFSNHYQLREEHVLERLQYLEGRQDRHGINCSKPHFYAKASNLFMSQFKLITQTLYHADQPHLPKLVNHDILPSIWNPVNIPNSIPLNRLHVLDVQCDILYAHSVVAIGQTNDVVDIEVIRKINSQDFEIDYTNKLIKYRIGFTRYEFSLRDFILSNMNSGPNFKDIDRLLMKHSNSFIVNK